MKRPQITCAQKRGTNLWGHPSLCSLEVGSETTLQLCQHLCIQMHTSMIKSKSNKAPECLAADAHLGQRDGGHWLDGSSTRKVVLTSQTAFSYILGCCHSPSYPRALLCSECYAGAAENGLHRFLKAPYTVKCPPTTHCLMQPGAPPASPTLPINKTRCLQPCALLACDVTKPQPKALTSQMASIASDCSR